VSTDAKPCIVCGAALRNSLPDVDNQPDGGIVATSHGNYGSTAFDPMNGEFVEFNVCDACLVRAGEQGRVLTARDRAPVTYGEVGRIGHVRRTPVYVDWHAGIAPYDDEAIDLDEEEIPSPPTGVVLDYTSEEIKKMKAATDRFYEYLARTTSKSELIEQSFEVEFAGNPEHPVTEAVEPRISTGQEGAKVEMVLTLDVIHAAGPLEFDLDREQSRQVVDLLVSFAEDVDE
jgi:hypothetical protein